MERVVELGLKLGALHRRQSQLVVDEQDAQSSIAIQKLLLIPEEGWPGPNDKTRDANRDKAYAADPTMSGLVVKLAVVSNLIILNHGEIDALEAERRGLEAFIRLQMSRALLGDFNTEDLEMATDDRTLDNASRSASAQAASERAGQIISELGYPPAPANPVLTEHVAILSGQEERVLGPLLGENPEPQPSVTPAADDDVPW